MKLEAGRYFGTRKLAVLAESVRLTLSTYEAESRQPWHTHENPTFFLQLSGDHGDESESQYEVQRSLTLSYHPSTSVHRSRVGARGMRGVNIEVTESWLGGHGLTESRLGSLRILQDVEISCRAARFFTRALAQQHPPSTIDSLVFELIEPFVHLEDTSESQAPAWLRQVRESILDGYAEPIGIAGLAAEAGVHPVYLCRAFRRQYGQSINELLVRVRASEACKLICQGMDAGPAALQVGFYDQFHLSRTLSNTLHFTPRELKRLVRTTF